MDKAADDGRKPDSLAYEYLTSDDNISQMLPMNEAAIPRPC